MFNAILKMTLSVLLLIFAHNTTAEEKAVMLDDHYSYCKMFYVFTGGDVPDECPKRRTVRKPPPPQPIAFSRLINFEFDSVALSSNSIRVLNDIVKMVQHEKMSQKSIRVEGHTDSIGTADYNQGLSEQRALAVKHYSMQHGVKPQRIQTAGFGFKRLHDADHPDDSSNRRAEFANLGTGE